MNSWWEKYNYLTLNFSEISAKEFYRDIFPVGSFQEKIKETATADFELPADGKGNGILCFEDKDGKIKKRLIFDDLEEIFAKRTQEFSFMSPVSYFGKNRTSANARYLHALTFDLDGVGKKELINLLFQIDNELITRPTYIVNSGNGLHLYYVFKDPIPLYPDVQKKLKIMKYAFTTYLWNYYTSSLEDIQYQGIMQGFRIVGSNSKLGSEAPVMAYRVGEKTTIEEMNKTIRDGKGIVTDITYKSALTLAEAKAKYPEWYQRRVIEKQPKKGWTNKAALYDWWFEKIKKEAKLHHRYFCIMCLAIYAVKSGVSFEKLKEDAYSLIDLYTKIAPNEPFKKSDADSALEMYNPEYKTFPIDDIKKVSGIEIPKNKRNGRKQKLHLRMARAIRDISQEEKGEKWNGRKSKEIIVAEFKFKNPKGTKADCIRATGLDKKTVYKWWRLTENAR